MDLNCNDYLTDDSVEYLESSIPERLSVLTLNIDLCDSVSDEALFKFFRKLLSSPHFTILETKDRLFNNSGLVGLFNQIVADSRPHLRKIDLSVDKPYQRLHDATLRYLRLRNLQMALADSLSRTFHSSSVTELMSFL